MRLSVVIPTLGRAALRDTLESIARCEPGPDEVIVVDGDPSSSARATVEEFAARNPNPPVRWVPSTRGASVQRNRGIVAATGDVVVFTDDDVLFDPNAFAALGKAYEDDAVVGATGWIVQRFRTFGNENSRFRRLLAPRAREGTMTSFGYPRRIRDPSVERDVESMQGCLMSARRDVAAQVGFDESLGRPQGYALLEDEDFSYRLSRLGRIRHVPDAVVHHQNVGFHSRDHRYFSWLVAVDRAYLFRKNFSRTTRARLGFAILIGILAAHRIVNREWWGIVGLIEGSAQAWRESRRSSRRAAACQ